MVSGVSVLLFGMLVGPGVSCAVFVMGVAQTVADGDWTSVLSDGVVADAVCSCVFCVVFSVSSVFGKCPFSVLVSMLVVFCWVYCPAVSLLFPGELCCWMGVFVL